MRTTGYWVSPNWTERIWHQTHRRIRHIHYIRAMGRAPQTATYTNVYSRGCRCSQLCPYSRWIPMARINLTVSTADAQNARKKIPSAILHVDVSSQIYSRVSTTHWSTFSNSLSAILYNMPQFYIIFIKYKHLAMMIIIARASACIVHVGRFLLLPSTRVRCRRRYYYYT